jgi:lysozyme family protein
MKKKNNVTNNIKDNIAVTNGDQTFNNAFEYVLKNEGDYVEHPKDSGETTKLGISLRFLKSLDLGEADLNNDMKIDKEDIKLVDINEAKKLYREHFWIPIKGDKITDEQIAIKIFDTAVNIGIRQTVLIMQRALNDIATPVIEGKLKVDGKIGYKTLEKLNSLNAKSKTNFLIQFVYLLSDFYKSLDKPEFIHGWLLRGKKLP